MIMGGRAAEDLIFNRFTTGASDDLKKATELARKMICQWGMNEQLGPVAYAEGGQMFLGRDLQQHRNISNETSRTIDAEVRKLLNECYERACSILKTNAQALDQVAAKLIEKETIDGEEVVQILQHCKGVSSSA